MSGRRLEASYGALLSQIGAHAHVREAAVRPTASTEFLARLGIAVGAIARDRRKAILELFEQVGRQIRRQGVTDLVSAFEADLFRVLGRASSKARHVLNAHYGDDLPFSAHRADLVRTATDFANLGGYRRLLATASSGRPDPRKDLWEVIAFRDFLAHGERWASPAVPPTIDFTYRTLSAELDRVETARSSAGRVL